MDTMNDVAFGPPQVPWITAGVVTVTVMTNPVGMGTMGTSERLPDVLVTAFETQHFVPIADELSICHQEWSAIVPRMGTVCPTFNAPTDKNAVPGPKRQLASSVFGVTIAAEEVGFGVEVGVDVMVGVEVGTAGAGAGVSVEVGTVPPTGAINMLKAVARSRLDATGMG